MKYEGWVKWAIGQVQFGRVVRCFYAHTDDCPGTLIPMRDAEFQDANGGGNERAFQCSRCGGCLDVAFRLP